MTSGEACRLLHVTRMTLARYSKLEKDGKPMIRRYKVTEGKYVYEDDDVYALIGGPKVKNEWRVIYARVTKKEGLAALDAQVKRSLAWCISNGISVSRIYKEEADGWDFSRQNRRAFHEMLRDVMEKNIRTIIIESPDRISPIGNEILPAMFLYMGIRVVYLINEKIDPHHKEDTMLETMRMVKEIKKLYDNSIKISPPTAEELMQRLGTHPADIANLNQGLVEVKAEGPDTVSEPVSLDVVGIGVPESGLMPAASTETDAMLDSDGGSLV